MSTTLKYINKKFELKELPQLRFGNPKLTVGKEYEVLDIEGSNFWILDDDGEKTSIGSCKFIIPCDF